MKRAFNIIVFLLFLSANLLIADELEDLLGDDDSAISGGTSSQINNTSNTDLSNDDYMVKDNVVKYFNDDPAEDGGIPNPFESLLKPPPAPKPVPTIGRTEEAPKPLRLKLMGVVINNDMKIALIKDLDKGETYELAEGEKTSDFSVVEISDGRVIIFSYRLNMRRTITLND